ncbi:hypothetical protein [Nonomuraea sp. NPDC003214]
MAVGLSQGKVSGIMNDAVQVTSFEVFECIAEGLSLPDSARMTLAWPRVIIALALRSRQHPSRRAVEHQQAACLAWNRLNLVPARAGALAQPALAC